MDLNETSTSTINKAKKKGSKKRLTFQDKRDVTKSEEDLKLRDSTQRITARRTKILTFGFKLIKSFTHLNVAGATYNSKSKKLILADGRGFFSLDLDASNYTVKREMNFPKYKFGMARIITYSEKYNVYFVLQKDFVIKVYNKDFAEICSAENPRLGHIMFLSFNPVKDELICGGFKGVKIWTFKASAAPEYNNPVPMGNYNIYPCIECLTMGKKLCTNMDFDVVMQRYYCFSESHFFCYDINGTMLFEIPNAHQSSIVSCAYSPDVSILLTSSRDSEIKSWNDKGSLLHVFEGHSRTVTKLLFHPSTAALFISGSLDGTVKVWSFHTLDVFYSLSLFQEGILWTGIIEDRFVYCCSSRNVHIYDLNMFTSFWTQVNSTISNLHICSAEGKSSRVSALSADNSLRIFSLHNGTKLCTVLPPPYPSMPQPILSFAYNRANGIVYFLLTPWDIWVYTARTDPACRAAVWSTSELQQHLHRKHPLASCIQKNEHFQHTRKRNFRISTRCECLCSLSSPLCYVTDEGVVSADNQEFLVLGMQDGRILFLHTSIQNLVYYEMTIYKDPVIHLCHDAAYQQLIIMCQTRKTKLIHFRSLPHLELISQLDLSHDTMVFTRLNNSLFVGLSSGIVNILNLVKGEEEEEQIILSGKDAYDDGINETKEASPSLEKYHNGPVLAVDACKNLCIFLSCGSDSVVKLWDMQKDLMAEITLDNTLSTACFLNNRGDILLAFKSNLYFISHSKTLGLLYTDADTSSVSAAESYIFETQPPDEQEREKIDVSKSEEMASYLIPYKGYTFTEDFTSELKVSPEKKGKTVWKLPLAPSTIYCSPCTSETSLKIFDFLLEPERPNLEEQDKVEMSERMIVTKDMKYVPRPKSAAPAEWEIPFFGVSPSSSLIETEIQPQQQVAEAERELDIVEPLPEFVNKEEDQIKEETTTEEAAIRSKSADSLDEEEILKPASESFIYGTVKEKQMKRNGIFKSIKSHREKKSTTLNKTEAQDKAKRYASKKLPRTEKLIKRMRVQKQPRFVSAVKGAVRSKGHIYTTYARSAQSALSVEGEKVFPALGTENLTPAEKRNVDALSSSSKTKSGEQEIKDYKDYVLWKVDWRRKQNERIQQAEERRILLEIEKRSCSRNHCFTPTNSQQYQKFPEALFETWSTWMKPYRQHPNRPYTVMEETSINLPREFPYRLAWGTPATPDLNIKLYHPKMKFSKERRISSLYPEKNLQPTKSIPDKGKFILVSEQIAGPSTPTLSPLENKLLSVRFPRQREKIIHSLLSGT